LIAICRRNLPTAQQGPEPAMLTISSSSFPEGRFPKRPIPAKAGVSLKPEHVGDILETDATMGFFEVHAENYMGAGGVPHALLSAIREKYPLSVHGVGMSIGGDRPISIDHLDRFTAVVERYQPGLVSEHLAWSTHDDIFYNDLLPLPYTQQTLARVAEHVDQVQSAIGRQILIENPATYLLFAQSTYSETDFLTELARRTGCGLLLDVNNVYVSATNHGFSPQAYLDEFPVQYVGEIHLAGHAQDMDEHGHPLLIDSHSTAVPCAVWDLYGDILQRTGACPTLVEWDNDVPAWPELAAQARRAGTYLAAAHDPSRPVAAPEGLLHNAGA
jgi:uncharacterized protein